MHAIQYFVLRSLGTLVSTVFVMQVLSTEILFDSYREVPIATIVEYRLNSVVPMQ